MGIEPNQNPHFGLNRTRTGKQKIDRTQTKPYDHKEPEPKKNPIVWVLKSSANW